MKNLLKYILVAVATIALSFGFTSCTDEPNFVGDPYFEIQDNLTGLEIDCLGNTDANPAQFVVRSNQSWQLVPTQDYNWTRIYPEDGGENDGVFRIIVDQNLTTEDRVAYFAVLVNGEEQPALFTVSQEKDSPRIKGAESEVNIEKAEGSFKLQVVSNVEWQVVGVSGDKDTENNTWFSVNSVEGDFINYTVTDNSTYDTRTAVVKVASVADPSLSAEISVVQAGMGADLDGLYVEWLMSAEDKEPYVSSFQDKGRVPATTGVAFLDYVIGEAGSAFGGAKRTIGGTGHPYVDHAWPGDYWLFTVPTVDIPAGTIVSIKYSTRSSAQGMKYWMMEVYDGDEWVPIGETTSFTGPDGNAFDYNLLEPTDGSSNIKVDLKITYKKNTKIGKIMIRQRCMSSIKGDGTLLSSPNGGTNRIAGSPDDRPQIAVLYVGNGSVGPVETAKFEYDGIEDKTIVFDGRPEGPATFTLKSSMRWTIETADSDWLHVTPERGAADELTEITVVADTNVTDQTRRATLKVTAGTTVDNIVVVQAPAPGAGQLNPFIAVSSPNNLEVDALGEIIDVEITGNVEYEVIIPEDCQSWISAMPVTMSAGDIAVDSRSFEIAVNESGAERNGTIKFVNTEANVEAAVNIHQGVSAVKVIYYETIGEVSGTTAFASIPWSKIGTGASAVTYSGGAKVDARKTTNQGETTSSAIYNIYTNPMMGDAPCSVNGNLYFGKDTSTDQKDNWFQINNISLSNVKVLQLGMGFYREKEVTTDSKPMHIYYKFNTDSDWVPYIDLMGERNWFWYSLPAFKVPEGATQVSFRFHAGEMQMFRIDDLTLVEGDPADLPVEPFPATWIFSENYMSQYTDSFQNDNVVNSLTGVGKISYYSVVEAGLQADPDNKFARTVGTTGHPFATGAWPGDYWLFEVPGNIKAGTSVNIKFITRVSATGHKFWMFEYFDGTEWKPTCEVLTETETGTNAEYTHMMKTDGKTNITVDETVTFATAMPSGVKFRFRCMANWQANGKGALGKPNGGTVRIAGDESGTSPVIKIVE